MSDHERYCEDDSEKRAHHNAMERKRRDQLKESFASLSQILSDANPSHRVKGDGPRSQLGRAKILSTARDQIILNGKRIEAHRKDIEYLKKELVDLQAAVELKERHQKKK